VTSLRILLVEDDELNQALVRAVLARSTYPLLRGCDVVTAGNLARARAVLADGGVDVVLLDMHLPDGSGLVLAAELQQAAAARQPAGAERAAVPHQVAARQPAGAERAAVPHQVAVEHQVPGAREAKASRQAEGPRSPVIVALSGAASEQRAAALAAGCAAVLNKPYSSAELCELIVAHLSDRREGHPPAG